MTESRFKKKMSELCNSSTTPHYSSNYFLTLLIYDTFIFISFILSHPLYFSYFIFFSPYLLKLLSFLSPLFLTTLLLLLSSILTLSFHNDSALHAPQSDPGFLLSTFLKITEKLRSKTIQKTHDQEMYNFDEFEVYKIVFNPTPMFDDHDVGKEIIPVEVSDSDSDCVTKFCTHEVSSVNVAPGERKLESFLELLDKFENMGNAKKVVDQLPCSKSNKVVGKLQKEVLVKGSEAATTPIKMPINNNDCSTVKVVPANNGGEYTSKVASIEHFEKINNAYVGRDYKSKTTSNGHLEKINEINNGGDYTSKTKSNGDLKKINETDNGGEYTPKTTSNGHLENINETDNAGEDTSKFSSNGNFEKINDAYNVGFNLDSSRSFDSSIWSYGSMRKEKEWKRTLACKLFEERHNGGGEDGMDSLWEAYETDFDKKGSKKAMTKSKSDTDAYASVITNVKKNNRKKSGIGEYFYDFENEEEEDDGEYEFTNGKICCLQALKMSSGRMNFGMGKSNFVKFSKAFKGMGWLHNVSKHGKKR